jgi:hypothetical protein
MFEISAPSRIPAGSLPTFGVCRPGSIELWVSPQLFVGIVALELGIIHASRLDRFPPPQQRGCLFQKYLKR